MINNFKRQFFDKNSPMTYIGSGSFGGKAQSLVSIHEVINDRIKAADFPGIDLYIPSFTVIRTDIFDAFMKRNHLFDIAYSAEPDARIAHEFQKAALPIEILGDLRAIVEQVHVPLAVRSSSRLEDDMFEPFAGVYATKMTPNNQLDVDTRFKKLVEAVKFVYASTFFMGAKDYLKVTKHSLQDEKMAVIIQEIVGSRFNDRFYPHLSGVARSYNFYPAGRSKAEEGVVNLALGLGKTIVDGGISWSFSPQWPKVNPPFGSVSDLLKQTQLEFWAVNMGKLPAYDPIKETEFLIRGKLHEADKENSLKYLASTIDNRSGRLAIGTGPDGPRILTFAPLLVLNDFPINSLIKKALSVCGEFFKGPVEIEFAAKFSEDKNNPCMLQFGFLQVRPMRVSTEEINIENFEKSDKNIFTISKDTMGNGTIDDIEDIVYVDPEKFEAKFSPIIADEIEELNQKLVTEKKPYLLIGFGRWGSSDPWLGIPVSWGQISGAKVIIEAGLKNMNVDKSQGSHFFHNLTSFNVKYFSLPYDEDSQINWNWLLLQNSIEKKRFVNHIKLNSPLLVKVDGRLGKGVIFKNGEIG